MTIPKVYLEPSSPNVNEELPTKNLASSRESMMCSLGFLRSSDSCEVELLILLEHQLQVLDQELYLLIESSIHGECLAHQLRIGWFHLLLS